MVHGLRGHCRDTWTKDNVCGPQELLSKDMSLSQTHILTLGYDANIVSVNGRASLNTLFQHSINLVQELSRVRRKDAVSWTLSSGNSLTTQIHVVRSPHHFCSALSRRADSQRCKPISLSNSQPDRLPCRHSIIRIEFRIPFPILLKSYPLREV